MKKIYMITNGYTNKRYINITDLPLCDIEITDPLLLKDIDHLYNRIGLAYIHYIKIEILAIIYDDRFIDDILRIYKNQYYICGLYNSEHKDNRVINIDTGETYENAHKAAKALGLRGASGIRRVCNKERKTAGGHRWAYYRDYYSI